MKSSKKSDLLLGAVLLAALALAGTLWRLADQQGLDRPTCLQNPVGVWGPLRLVFKEPMQVNSVAPRVKLMPDVQGQWAWQGLDLVFTPRFPMKPSLNTEDGFTISLSSGAQNLAGKSILVDSSCKESVRPAKIVYQAVGQPQGKLVEIGLDGKDPKPLAQFNLPILSFAPSRDGHFLVVAAQNEHEGSNLWLVDIEKGTTTILLDCKQDHCENPAWAPDGHEVAYDRLVINPQGLKQLQLPQVWRVDLQARNSAPLMAGLENHGQFPQYAPDGTKLAYFDGENEGIRIVDLNGNGQTVVKTNASLFTWSPDAASLFYFNDVTELENHYMNTYVYHLPTQQSEVLLNEYTGQFEFGRPTWSPDGKWITLAVRLVRGGMSQQLVMMRVDGSDVKTITDTQVFTHSSYHWDPNGDWLVFQRLELGNSSLKPQILVWNPSTGETKLVVEGGGMPDWLP